MSDPTILITLEQAEAALECIDRDIERNYTDDHPNYHDTGEIMFLLRRAELRLRLASAINANKEIK
jgi:hypothetical protein